MTRVQTASQPRTTPPAEMTLADVLARILADAALPDTRQRALASAIRTVGRALQRPLDMLPAQPAQLRPLLAPVTPAMAGLSAGSWRNA